MNFTHEINHVAPRNSSSNPVWMDGLRITLGLLLFIQGILFLEHSSDVFYIFSQSQDLISMKKASMLTSVVHIAGGLMIVFGLLTRLALLCQIPVVLGALLVVNPQRSLQLDSIELWMPIVVLGLLLFFMIVGPGRYSVDNKVLRQQK